MSNGRRAGNDVTGAGTICEDSGMIPPRAPHPLLLRNDFWRIRFAQWLKTIPDDASPERLHELRGALGRLMVWLRLAGQTELRTHLRDLRREVGAVRDLDVVHEQLGSATPAGLVAEIERQRTLLVRRLQFPAVERLVRDLEEVPPLNFESARAAACGLFRKVRSAGKKLRNSPSPESAHRLRRKLRDYRFALEWMGEKTKPLRPLLQTLGDFNDQQILARHSQDSTTDGEALEPPAEDLEQCVHGWRRLRKRLNPPGC